MRGLIKLLIVVIFPLSLEAGEWDSSVKISGVKFVNDNGYTKTKSWFGTGTCVYNATVKGTNEDVSFILTNSHVAPDGDTIYSIIVGDDVYKDTLFVASTPEADRHSKGDLGLILVKGIKIPPVKIAKADPEPGTMVHQYSYAWAGPCYKFEGHFLGHKNPDNTVDDNVDFGDFIVYPGCSGSGVFLPGGYLFGLCYATTVVVDAKGNAIKDAKGNIIPKVPCMMVPNHKVRTFLYVNAPFILGAKNEKGPDPRPFPTKP